jgi:hypothetical protein
MSADDHRRAEQAILERIMLMTTATVEQSGHMNHALGRIEKLLESLLQEAESQTKLLRDIYVRTP